jgi:hypothetical protein
MFRYSITVPVADNDNIPREDIHAWMTSELSARFGGWSQVDIVGGWYPEGAANPCTERSIRYEVLTDDDGLTFTFAALAAHVAAEMAQDAVLMTGPEPCPYVFVAPVAA